MPSRFHRRKRRPARRRKMPIVKLIKKVIQNSAEHKFVDSSFSTGSVEFVSPVKVILNTITETAGFNGRTGIIVKPSRLKIRFGIKNADGAVASSVRVYVIQSMDNTDPSAMPIMSVLMPPLKDSNFAYRILYDRTWQFGLGLNRNVFKTIIIPGKKMIDCRWGSTSGTDLTEGRLNIHVVTNSTVASDVSYEHVARFYYTDI